MRALIALLLASCAVEPGTSTSTHGIVAPAQVCEALVGNDTCTGEDLRCQYGPIGGSCCLSWGHCCTWTNGDDAPVCGDADPPCPGCG